jgi:hypothetical protein
MMSAAHAPPGMRQAHRSELKRRLLWLPLINAARRGLQRLAQCLNFKLKLAQAEAGWRVRRSTGSICDPWAADKSSSVTFVRYVWAIFLTVSPLNPSSRPIARQEAPNARR